MDPGSPALYDQFARTIKGQDQVETLLETGAVMVAGMVTPDDIPVIRRNAAEIPRRQTETVVIPAMNGGQRHQGDAGIGEGPGRRPELCLAECQEQIDDVIRRLRATTSCDQGAPPACLPHADR